MIITHGFTTIEETRRTRMYKVLLEFIEDITLLDGYKDSYDFKKGNIVKAEIYDRGVTLRIGINGEMKWSTLFSVSELSQYTKIIFGGE